MTEETMSADAQEWWADYKTHPHETFEDAVGVIEMLNDDIAARDEEIARLRKAIERRDTEIWELNQGKGD